MLRRFFLRLLGAKDRHADAGRRLSEAVWPGGLQPRPDPARLVQLNPGVRIVLGKGKTYLPASQARGVS